MALLTSALLLGLYILMASGAKFWDRDEPRFAQATVEMVQSGNWLYPTFQGRLRPDKPILIYWAMAIAIKLAGMRELAFRLPCCLGLMGAGLCTYAAGRKMFSAKVGWWALVMLGTAILPAIMGTLATADGVLLFFLTATMTVFIYGFMDEKWHWKHGLTMGIALGGAWLTKGPVALLIVGSIALTAYWNQQTSKQQQGMKRQIALAIAISIAIFLAWAMPANMATNGEFAKIGLGRHVFSRMVTPAEGHGGTQWWQYLLLLPTYLPVIVAGFFPWTLFLPAGIYALCKTTIGDQKTRAVLWGWILPTLAVMSLVATKLPHYILPAFSGLAVLTAATLCQAHEGRLSGFAKNWLRGGIWFFAPVGIGILTILLVGVIGLQLIAGTGEPTQPSSLLPKLQNHQTITINPVSPLWWGICLATAAAGFLWIITVIQKQIREHVKQTATLALIGVGIGLALIWSIIIPSLEPAVKLAKPIAEIINTSSSQNTPWAVCGYEEPSLTFYVGRGVPEKLDGDKAIDDWLKKPHPGVLVIEQERWNQAMTTLGNNPLPCHQAGEVEGINHNQFGRKQRILVIVKKQTSQNS